MGKSSSPAPAPDPNIGIAALKNAELGEQYLSFAKDAWKVSQDRQVELDAITKELSTLQIGLGKESIANAQEDRARYENTFKPIEDEFVAEAKAYGSEGRQQQAAATASADVQKAAADQRQVSQRTSAAMGINPTSGRFAAVDRMGETQIALADAGAKNTARTATRDKGLALKADLVNMGRGLPTQAAQGASLGMGANQSAVGMVQGANQNYMASTGIMQGGYGMGMQGYSNQAGILQNKWNTEVDIWRTQEQQKSQAAAGIGSAFGAVLGFLSDEDAKTDKEEIPDGEALDAVRNMPVEEWAYKPGMGDGGGERHVGTYAQDFQKQTGKGNGKMIPAQDAIGITMKAVQDLANKVDDLTAAIGMGQPEMRAAA